MKSGSGSAMDRVLAVGVAVMVMAMTPWMAPGADVYWNNFSGAGNPKGFNVTGNWLPTTVPGAADKVWITNFPNAYNLAWTAPVTNAAAVFDMLTGSPIVRLGGSGGPVAWTVTNSVSVNNSGGAGKAQFWIDSGTWTVTNAAGTAAMTINWGAPVGTSGMGRLTGGDLVVDHLYASNAWGQAGLDALSAGSLTTRGDSELAMIGGGGAFYIANYGSVAGTWTILGGTNKVGQSMYMGNPNLFGGTPPAATATVVVAGNTAKLLANNAVYVGAQGNGIGLLVVTNEGYAQVANGLFVGNSGTAGNRVLVTGTNSVLKTQFQVYVRSYNANNTIRVENGGKWDHNSGNNLYFNGAGGGTNAAVVIDGAGSSFVNFGSIELGGGAGVQDGRGWLIVQNGATASSPNYGWFSVGVGTGDSYGEIRVTGPGSSVIHPSGPMVIGKGGYYTGVGYFGGATGRVYVADGAMLETGTAYMGTNDTGLLSVDGGILQFVATNPDITQVTPGRVIVTNSTISFRGVTTVDVFGNVGGTKLTNATFQGNNAFRLNNATNASTGQAYVFDTGRGATNYTRLELVNNSTYRGGAVTVGSGGTLVVSNGTSTVASNLTFQSGGTFAVHITTNAATSGSLAVGGTTVALGGATLRVTLGDVPVEGQFYPILANPGTAPLAGLGTFSAASVDSVYAGKTYTLAIRYGAGDGNDVAVSLATKGTLMLLR